MGRVMISTSVRVPPLLNQPARMCSIAGFCGRQSYVAHSRPVHRAPVYPRTPASHGWGWQARHTRKCQGIHQHDRQDTPPSPIPPPKAMGSSAWRGLALLALSVLGPWVPPPHASSAQPPTALTLQRPQQHPYDSSSPAPSPEGCEAGGVLRGGSWSLLGQGASGVTYRVTTPEGGDYVVKKAGNTAQERSLARELRALRVLERVGAGKEGGWVKRGVGTCGPLLIMTPFFDGTQVASLEVLPSGVVRDGAVCRLADIVHTMVVQARLVSSDVQVLVGEGGSEGLQLIDLTEAQFLDEGSFQGEEQRLDASVGAFVSEVLTLLPPQDTHAQTLFAQALVSEHEKGEGSPRASQDLSITGRDLSKDLSDTGREGSREEGGEWRSLCRLMPQLLPLAQAQALEPFFLSTQ